MTSTPRTAQQSVPENDGSRLFVHETITCRSLQGRARYQEIAKGMRGFDMLGTWQVVGMTGRWPTVLNLWEVPGGWDGWSGFLHRTYGAARNELHTYFNEFDEVRSGGNDMLITPMPWSPTTTQLTTAGVRGSLFMHETTSVHPGAAWDYLAAKQRHFAPIAAEHNHRLVGMYEAPLDDTQVVTVWATTITDHIHFMRSHDPQISHWREQAREFITQWHEELMTPAPGTLLAATDTDEMPEDAGRS